MPYNRYPYRRRTVMRRGQYIRGSTRRTWAAMSIQRAWRAKMAARRAYMRVMMAGYRRRGYFKRRRIV